MFGQGAIPWNLLCVSKCDDHLIHDSISTYGTADELHGHARRIVWNKIVLIETFQICVSNASGQCRDVIYV